MIEVVTFTGTLTHTSKHRQTAVRFGDVVDEFHHIHGFAHTRAAEQSDLTALSERTYQVDHLDAGLEQFLRRAEFVIRRCFAMDRCCLCLVNRTTLINGVAQHVHDAAQSTFADWHGNRSTGVGHHQTAAQAVRGTQSDGTNNAVAELLLHFKREGSAL